MKDFILMDRLVSPTRSKLLLHYDPSETDWLDYWTPKSGNWDCKGGWLIGNEPDNKGGILFSKKEYPADILFSFTMKTELPATRDLNATYCAQWNDKTDYIGESYVCGLNGWYEGKSGIERLRSNEVKALTGLYKYEPGTEVRMTCGVVSGRNFLFVDDDLIIELGDPNPLQGGFVGFSAYCTKLLIKDIDIYEPYFEKISQRYEPEFI